MNIIFRWPEPNSGTIFPSVEHPRQSLIRYQIAGPCSSGVYCAGAGLSEGRVDAVLGRIACLAAGLWSTTGDGPPAGWEDVLPDALMAMARVQSSYTP